jgi:hypothetical protein
LRAYQRSKWVQSFIEGVVDVLKEMTDWVEIIEKFAK